MIRVYGPLFSIERRTRRHDGAQGGQPRTAAKLRRQFSSVLPRASGSELHHEPGGFKQGDFSPKIRSRPDLDLSVSSKYRGTSRMIPMPMRINNCAYRKRCNLPKLFPDLLCYGRKHACIHQNDTIIPHYHGYIGLIIRHSLPYPFSRSYHMREQGTLTNFQPQRRGAFSLFIKNSFAV